MSNPFTAIGRSDGVYCIYSDVPPISSSGQAMSLPRTEPTTTMVVLRENTGAISSRLIPLADGLQATSAEPSTCQVIVAKKDGSNADFDPNNGAKAKLPGTESSPEMRRLTGLIVNGELTLKGKLSQSSMNALCRILADPDCGLCKLVLHYGQLSVDNIRMLSEALKVNRTLTALDLGYNEIGDVGAASLSEALKVNRTLTALDLSDNKIGDEGACSLSEALKINDRLTRLEFWENEVSDIGALLLTKALEVNLALASFGFEFGGSDMQVQCTASIESSLQRNQQFHLTKKHAAGFMALVSGLGQYPGEIFDLLIEQMAALPPNRRQESIATMEAMSAAIGGPPKKT